MKDLNIIKDLEAISVKNEFNEIEVHTLAPTYDIKNVADVEEMKALFFDSDALIEPSYKLWQLNRKGTRYYYKINEDGNVGFYPSVTTILAQTMPQNHFLVKWMADKGIEEAEKIKLERASYGTFMHAIFEELLINGTYDLDDLSTELYKYIERNNLPLDFMKYEEDLKKDLLSFAQFVIDYDVKPLAVEISLIHPQHKYAGMIDLPCTMLNKKDGETRINAIIDFKSGKKGFFEAHEIQLGMYRDLWNSNFDNMQIEKIYNFAPKDWRKSPTYNLKDQTQSKSLKKIPYLIALANIEDNEIDKSINIIGGKIELTSKSIANNVTTLTISEILTTNKNGNIRSN